jgi:hypothetical protein
LINAAPPSTTRHRPLRISVVYRNGWHGDVDSVKFAHATAAALNAGTWLAMEVSWLCPDMAERFGSDNAAWPTSVATKQRISTTTVVERWASGFNYVLDLAPILSSPRHVPGPNRTGPAVRACGESHQARLSGCQVTSS